MKVGSALSQVWAFERYCSARSVRIMNVWETDEHDNVVEKGNDGGIS